MTPSTPIKRKSGAIGMEGDASKKKRRLGNLEVYVEVKPKSTKATYISPSQIESQGKHFLEQPRHDIPQSGEQNSSKKSTYRQRSLSIDSLPAAAQRRSRSVDSLSESGILVPTNDHSTASTPTPPKTRAPVPKSRMQGVVISSECSIPPPIYRPFRTEVAENQRLEVPGEDDALSEGLPVRNLDNFTFYGHNGQYLPFDLVVRCLENLNGRTILGSGTVTRHLDDPADGDSDLESMDTELLVSLQPLVDFWVDYSPDQSDEVWVATEDAWYILQNPETLYTGFYQPFWLAHHLTWQIANAVREDKTIAPSDFLQRLNRQGHDEAISIMGRELDAKDFDGDFTILYILDQFSSLTLKKFLRTPLLREFANRAERREITMQKLFDINRAVEPSSVYHSNKTVTMPLVHELTTGIFLTTLLKAGKELDDAERCHDLLQPPEPPNILHPDSPTLIEWESPLGGYPGYFTRVCLDGESYNVGDIIMVNPGEDEVRHRAESAAEACSRSSNELSNKVWFCKIISLCDRQLSRSTRQGNQVAHVQWYSHGAKTILQETAHPYGLFALAECADVPVGAIMGRCSVQHLRPGDQEPNDYHCSFLWDADHCRFLDQAVLAAFKDSVDESPHCPCCAFNEDNEIQEMIIYSDEHVAVRGMHYHRNDFVYIAATPNNPYLIGQIRRFILKKRFQVDDIMVELTRFGRYDDVACAMEKSQSQSHIKKDELRLFMTEQVESYPLSLIEGKTFIYDKEKARSLAADQSTECFYVDRRASKVTICDWTELGAFDPDEISVCKRCSKSAAEEQQRLQDYMTHRSPLRAMELFAGAGGLSTGLEQSGFVKTCWAVEISSGAAATFQANHTDARVYNQDTNVCLQSAIDIREGKEYSPLYSLADQKELPPMPQRGDVDLITGGFPCQSFSGMNHQRHKRPDDIRTTLVANMLSYVEFYQPRYVLMENVKGLLQHHIQDFSLEQDEASGMVGERVIKMGIVKFVLRALTRLGYQAQIKVLQAADYGSPQRRERVIIWGALRSHAIPDYPLPTHVASDCRVPILNLPTKDKLVPARRSEKGCAPFRALVISDAISDLPAFEWKNPKIYAKVKADKKHLSQWAELSATSNPACPLTGFLEPVDYATPPKTTYQRMMRGGQTQVTLHCSRTYSAKIVERKGNFVMTCLICMDLITYQDRLWHVCNNAAGPEDLPRSLWTPVMHKAGSKKLNYIWQSRFCRLRWREPFNTALTSCLPFSKGGKILHPTQKRVITARECARSQGFPDHYEFVQSEDNAKREAWARLMDDIHKQIGNAVPVPLARALGNSLGKALVKERSRGRGFQVGTGLDLSN